jgi:hypothetical protein
MPASDESMGRRPVKVAPVIRVGVVSRKSSADSISRAPPPGGRDAAASLPSGFPELKIVSAAAELSSKPVNARVAKQWILVKGPPSSAQSIIQPDVPVLIGYSALVYWEYHLLGGRFLFGYGFWNRGKQHRSREREQQSLRCHLAIKTQPDCAGTRRHSPV